MSQADADEFDSFFSSSDSDNPSDRTSKRRKLNKSSPTLPDKERSLSPFPFQVSAKQQREITPTVIAGSTAPSEDRSSSNGSSEGESSPESSSCEEGGSGGESSEEEPGETTDDQSQGDSDSDAGVELVPISAAMVKMNIEGGKDGRLKRRYAVVETSEQHEGAASVSIVTMASGYKSYEDSSASVRKAPPRADGTTTFLITLESNEPDRPSLSATRSTDPRSQGEAPSLFPDPAHKRGAARMRDEAELLGSLIGPIKEVLPAVSKEEMQEASEKGKGVANRINRLTEPAIKSWFDERVTREAFEAVPLSVILSRRDSGGPFTVLYRKVVQKRLEDGFMAVLKYEGWPTDEIAKVKAVFDGMATKIESERIHRELGGETEGLDHDL